MKIIMLLLMHVHLLFALENIALVSFEALGGLDSLEAKMIASRLENELGKDLGFRVVERAQMNAILQEQGFQNSSCTGAACMVEMGKVLGVSKVVTGHVGKIGSLYSLNGKLVDVESGEIVKAAYVDVRGSLEEVFLKGCSQLARQLAGQEMSSSKPSDLPIQALEEKGKNEVLEPSSEGKTWYWWLLGGALVAGGVGTYVLLSGAEAETTQRTVEVR